MTKEEAEKYANNMTYRDVINNLMKARSIPYRKATFIKVNELLKALEQEPCEDAIDREQVNDILGHCIHSQEDYYLAIKMLDELPSVKPQEPQTGHWISHYDEDAKEGWYECDRCHTERAFNTDFCPDCGCRMVEPQEGANE